MGIGELGNNSGDYNNPNYLQGTLRPRPVLDWKGNRLFKEGKFELAKAKYEKVLREYNHVNPQDDEEGKVFLNSRNLLHLNVAACYLKMGESRKSIEACNKMVRIDKSSEADATAALLKLKQKEQEVEKKARKQLKGLFDKKPGEIAGAVVQNTEDHSRGENEKKDDETDSDGDEVEAVHEEADGPPRMGLFSQIWPTGRRLFTSLGLQRCTIL